MRALELRTADGRCIAHHVHLACSFRSRCVGLLRHRHIPEQEGLLLVPGGTVHTLGMRFDIDVVFLNRQMRILALVDRVAPWRIVVAPKDTARVLELAAGRIAATQLTAGTYLVVDGPSDESNEGSTIKMPRSHRTSCERAPIRFSLRLPSVLRNPPPCRPARDARATTKPNVES